MARAIRKTRRPDAPRVYQLMVTLMDADPPIWRRLLVAGDTTLPWLDRIIQEAMGWTNSHMHTFTAGGVLYAEPSPDWGTEVEDERRRTLSAIVREAGEAFVYEYDLGDSWRHQVLVEEVRFADKPVKPSCVEGARACPPEDCGGIGGYYDKLAILADPAHEEHGDVRDWMEGMTGGPFHPDAFDLAAANARIRKLGRSRQS